MTDRVLHVTDAATDALRLGIAAIQQEQAVTPTFPPEVEAAAASLTPTLPDLDLTDVPFWTIDPPGSMDLDQAMFLARDGDGYLVQYAIADLAAFIEPGGAIDVEANKRGETLYGADATIPLHPTVMSEGSASLLPDQLRPALVWTIHLDAKGSMTDKKVERARVTSRRKLDYPSVQQQINEGSADDALKLIGEIGQLRQQQEIARGGVSLPLPEQEVDIANGEWRLELRQPLPVENWNAQISLLTGIAGADLMLAGNIGILRTLPPAPDWAVSKLRRRAKALRVDWPAAEGYPDFVRALDPSKPNEAAMTVACTSLLRGAAYVGFDGAPPAQNEHAALATPYAHVTAPLRRLVDRYGLEVCVALCAGQPVPDWVRSALGVLPETMRDADRRAHAYENAVINLVEASLLQSSVGQTFAGVITECDDKDPTKGSVQIADPAVEAPVSSASPVPVGEAITVTLAQADPATRKVAFTL